VESLINQVIPLENPISHVLFSRTQTAKASYKWLVIIYLQNKSVPQSVQFLHESAPTIIWVSRSWGLPVPPEPFPEQLRHCGTFRGILTISEDLGVIPAVSFYAALAYFLAKHEHYGHLRTVRAWTFLYNVKHCSDYLNSQTGIVIIRHFNRKINQSW